MSKSKSKSPVKTTAIENIQPAQRQATIEECFTVVSQACELAPIAKAQHLAVEHALIRIRQTLKKYLELTTPKPKK